MSLGQGREPATRELEGIRTSDLPIDGSAEPKTIGVLQGFFQRRGFLVGFYQGGVWDEATSSAVRTFQRIHELESTGVFDAESFDAAVGWWCGVLYQRASTIFQDEQCAQVILRGNLRVVYRVDRVPAPIQAEARDSIRRAFVSWSQAFSSLGIRLSFRENGDEADLVIRWGDLPKGVAGEGSAPAGCHWASRSGEIVLRAGEPPGWSTDGGEGSWDVEYVVLHELGHLWGIPFCSEDHAVMKERVRVNSQSYPPKRRLTDGDIEELRKLYAGTA